MNDDQIARYMANRPSLAVLMGFEAVLLSPDHVVLEMDAAPTLGNANGVLHGGAILALADHCAGTAAMLNLPEGMTTVTTESKINFLRAVSLGDRLRAEATPLHKGRTTSLWQVDITRGDGKRIASSTQGQMMLAWRAPAS